MIGYVAMIIFFARMFYGKYYVGWNKIGITIRLNSFFSNKSFNFKDVTSTVFENEFLTITKKNGKEIFWYENGNKMMESFFVNDHEEGLWQQWYPNGQKKVEVNYSGGKYDGLWQQWYNNGQMKKNVKFVDGKKGGKEVTWKKDGTIKSEVIYKDGKIIKRLQK